MQPGCVSDGSIGIPPKRDSTHGIPPSGIPPTRNSTQRDSTHRIPPTGFHPWDSTRAEFHPMGFHPTGLHPHGIAPKGLHPRDCTHEIPPKWDCTHRIAPKWDSTHMGFHPLGGRQKCYFLKLSQERYVKKYQVSSFKKCKGERWFKLTLHPPLGKGHTLFIKLLNSNFELSVHI